MEYRTAPPKKLEISIVIKATPNKNLLKLSVPYLPAMKFLNQFIILCIVPFCFDCFLRIAIT